MQESDLDAVLAVEQSVQRYPWTRGQFADSLAAGHWCRIDDEGGELRGYAIMMPAVDEAELLTIGVAASHQRKGLGRALLAGMLALAREKDMRRVLLEVRPSNTAAVALYLSAGFAEVGLRRGYYRDAAGSEDALVMACDLPSPACGRGAGERVHG